jgi:crotonobetainyl-CoA:carnitine CoA-transferase CaiB-like acyl-CoA transferase
MATFKTARPPQSDGAAVAGWRDKIYKVLSNKLKTATVEHWETLLSEIGVWCITVNDYAAFLAHPQAQAYLTKMTHPVGGEYTAVAPGISFSDDPEPMLFTAPAYGADSRSVLAEFGFDDELIDKLVNSGAVYEGANT